MYSLPPDTPYPRRCHCSMRAIVLVILSHRDALSLIWTADTSVTTCGRVPGETVHPLSPPPHLEPLGETPLTRGARHPIQSPQSAY